MGRLTTYSILKICFLIVQTSFVYGDSKNDINDYILGLKYDKSILSYTGDKVNPIPTNGRLDKKQNFVILEHKKITLNNARANIEVLAGNKEKTFPGSLLLANPRVYDNDPDFLALNRNELEYTFDLTGMQAGEGTFTIFPSYAEYKLQHDLKLRMWFEKYYQGHTINAVFHKERALAYTMYQMMAELGTDFKLTDVAADIDFDAINEAKKTVMVHKFRKIFYTVTAQPPETPADVFDSTVSLEAVKAKVNDDNPPLFVDTVSYGTVIYVKTETTSVDKEAKSFMIDNLNSFNVSKDFDIEVQKKLKNLSFKIFVMGDGTKSVRVFPPVKSMREVNKIISQNITMTQDNVGYPLSYTIEFLKDNSRAVINGTTEYNDVAENIYKKGRMEIDHSGDYVASFKFEWDEISYDENGAMQVERKGWSDNWKNIVPKYESEIRLTGQSRNISIYARARTGLSSEWWVPVLDCPTFDLVPHRFFAFSGTAENPQVWVTPSIPGCQLPISEDEDQTTLGDALDEQKIIFNIIETGKN